MKHKATAEPGLHAEYELVYARLYLLLVASEAREVPFKVELDVVVHPPVPDLLARLGLLEIYLVYLCKYRKRRCAPHTRATEGGA